MRAGERVGRPGVLQIDEDATFYVGSLDPGQRVTHTAAPDRRAYLFAISGALAVNGFALDAGDQARMTGETSLAIEARAPADLILIDLP
jgi:redox-sensitive bicupin YhaK (pirin superfamily)